MKNLIRNLIIVCLLVIAAVVVTPKAFATIANSDATGNIIVHGVESGIDATAYRLMTVNISDGQPQDPVYTWESSVATWMEQHGYGDWVGDNNAVADTFDSRENKSDRLAKFYDEVAKAIRATQNPLSIPTKYEATADANGDVSFLDGNGEKQVKMGNYLVLMENGKRVYKPLSANIVPSYSNNQWNVADGIITKDTEVIAKSSKPTIEKTVEGDKTVAIGDVLTYTLEIDVPKYPAGTTNKTLNVGDVFSSGLDFVEIVSVKGDGEDLTLNTNYTVEEPSSTNGRTLTINFGGDTLYPENAKYNKIIVTYKAKVNSEAKVTQGEDNTATLTYNVNPYGNKEETPHDEVTVYTYGLDLLKTGVGNDANGLAGAEFNLTKGNKTLCFTKNSSNVFVYAGEETDGACPTGSSKTLVSQSDGKVTVNGLDTGTYTLTETKAPNDYVKLQAPRTYTIEDSDPFDGKVDVEGSTTGYVTDVIANKKGITLPITGGIGTLLFSLIGILFMGISVVLVRNILKKKEVQL